MRTPLKGKTAIITGGARGIGAAVAETLAEQGVNVVLADVIDAADTVADIISRVDGAQLASQIVDVRDEEQVKACIKFAVDTFGSIDIMVNNAGTCGRVSLEEIDLETWERDIDTNLKGTFLFAKHCLHPYMVEQGSGAIVNISSIAGIMGGPSAGGEGARRSGPAYAASKGGVIALTKWIAKDYGQYGITCNSVAPGPIASAMTASLEYDFSQQFIKNFGDPIDIAEAVAYAAGAPFLTGQVIRVCGGAAVG